MQKIITFVVFLLLSSSVFAQHEPIQPFEDLGIKVKVLTLSNGKYQESFPNDTLVRIGNIMYNRVTNEVVAVVKEDTLYGEFDLKPEVMSRWLSPDPLAAKYPNWSPYVAMNDNPVLFIDPDGKDAIISVRPGANGSNGTVISGEWDNYTPIKLDLPSFKNEKVISLKNDDYLFNIFSVLNKTGFIVTPDELIRDIEEEESKYE